VTVQQCSARMLKVRWTAAHVGTGPTFMSSFVRHLFGSDNNTGKLEAISDLKPLPGTMLPPPGEHNRLNICRYLLATG